MSAQKKLSDKELTDLGRKLVLLSEIGYINKKQAILYSFYKGMATGFGVFLGGTILIALLLWVLSFFGQIPLVSHFVNVLNQSLQSK